MDVSDKIGVALRRYRYKHNMTQVDLAAFAETDRSYISEIENGKINMSLDMFIRLCGALEVAPWDLLKEALSNARR